MSQLAADLQTSRILRDGETGWRRQTRELWDPVELWPWVETIPVAVVKEPAIVTDLRAKVKYVGPHKWPITSGEQGREYLRTTATVNGVKRFGWRRDDLVYLDLQDPYFYAGGGFSTNTGRMVVVDIDHCHWQIAEVGTADMRLTVDQGRVKLGYGHVEWPRHSEVDGLDRDTRLSITGMLAAQRMQWHRYGCVEDRFYSNPYLAPGCRGVIHLTLQAIACEAIEQFRCLHVVVDSFVISEDVTADFLAWLKERWHLDASVRARGFGAVYGLNVWEIRATKPGDLPYSTKWVDNWRHGSRQDPPFQPQPSTEGLSWLDRRIRDQLAAKRAWLVERRRTDPGWP